MPSDRRRIHAWDQPARQTPTPPVPQGGSLIEQHLYSLGLQIGQVLTKVEGLEKGGAGIKRELRDEAAAIRRAIDGLASELRDELNEQDERLTALEQLLAEQAAEARGIRRALGWGATLVSGAGVLLGWFLSKFGTLILFSLGLGGSGGGK